MYDPNIFDDMDVITDYKHAKQWIPEARRHGLADVPVILVGCKSDLRNPSDGDSPPVLCVTYQQAEDVASHVGALSYMECSTVTGQGVQELKAFTARVALLRELRTNRHSSRLQSGCIIC